VTGVGPGPARPGDAAGTHPFGDLQADRADVKVQAREPGGAHEPEAEEEHELTVRVEFVVVDGPEAAAWRARQSAAIRALLEWMAERSAA
jgi:hypothetical protein